MRNYLLRLGWAHGNDEIISTEEAIAWFGLDSIGRSPARFDLAKLNNLNGHYLRAADNGRLASLVLPRIAKRLGTAPDSAAEARLAAGMEGLKARAETLEQLADNAMFYVRPRPLPIEEKAAKLLTPEARGHLAALAALLAEAGWTAEGLEARSETMPRPQGLKLGQIAQPLRAALTGSTVSPGVFEVMVVLGKAEVLGRLGPIRGVTPAGLLNRNPFQPMFIAVHILHRTIGGDDHGE